MHRKGIDSNNSGSGLFFFWKDKILLLLRSSLVAHPLSWGIPGGMLLLDEMKSDKITDEIKLKSAIRECREETGSVPPFAIFDQIEFKSGPFSYTTFLCHMPPEAAWNIRLNWEHLKYYWCDKNKLPSNLHPGVKYVVKTLPQYFL